MKITPTTIPDVLVIEPQIHEDERGFFMETYRASWFEDAGLPSHFVQDNHSRSGQGTLRGLHYQIRQPQGKLVRAVAGEIFDVAVDVRRSSPTCGKWVGVRLSAQNHLQAWVPVGFAHGFYVLSDWAEVVYKTTDYYAPEWERCLLWNDTDLGIDWPLLPGLQPLVSKKDGEGSPLSAAELFD